MQIIEQTKEEKMAMYMKLPKKQLVEMLIESNRVLDTLAKTVKYNDNIEQSEPLACDICGNHPSSIIITQSGRYCHEHVKY